MTNYTIISTPTRSKYLVSDSTDIITNEIRRLGSFEDHIVKEVISLLQNVKDPYILDVGANIGTFSIPIALAYKTCLIECYEIQQRMFYQLCSNILLNDLDNINAHWCGISDETTTKFIDVLNYSTSGNYGAYTLDKRIREINPQGNQYSTIQKLTKIFKLDDLNISKPPSLIKIDVEGLELAVLSGALNLISAYKPILVLECWEAYWFSQQRNMLLSWLSDHNYVVVYKCGDNLIFK